MLGSISQGDLDKRPQGRTRFLSREILDYQRDATNTKSKEDKCGRRGRTRSLEGLGRAFVPGRLLPCTSPDLLPLQPPPTPIKKKRADRPRGKGGGRRIPFLGRHPRSLVARRSCDGTCQGSNEESASSPSIRGVKEPETIPRPTTSRNMDATWVWVSRRCPSIVRMVPGAGRERTDRIARMANGKEANPMDGYSCRGRLAANRRFIDPSITLDESETFQSDSMVLRQIRASWSYDSTSVFDVDHVVSTLPCAGCVASNGPLCNSRS